MKSTEQRSLTREQKEAVGFYLSGHFLSILTVRPETSLSD